MFSFFYPITGGRVGEIVGEEAKLCGKKKEELPLSSKDNSKLEKFCDNYKDLVEVGDAYKTFHVHWENAKMKAGENVSGNKILFQALTKSFKGDLLMAMFSKLVWGVLVVFSIAFFVFEILDFIKAREDHPPTKSEMNYAYALCVFFFVTMFVLSVGIQQMGVYSAFLGAKVKAALTTAIYKKMMSREAFDSKADVVSLISKDVDKMAEACLSLQYLWSGIFETAAVFGLCLILVGSPILPGLGLMCVFLPGQYYLGLKVAYMKKDLAEISNERISSMEEILRAIKLIKIYGWGNVFFGKINDIRADEAVLLNKINRIKSAILGLTFCLPPLLSMVIFGTIEATGKIDSVMVFTTLSFFNTLRVPFSKLPKSLRDVLDAISCADRIQAFLFEPDLASAEEVPKKDDDGQSVYIGPDHKGIVFRNVSVSYGNNAPMMLSNINLNIPHGSLVMVAGPVASGKSNLLKSILGDLTVREGDCFVSRSKAYVPQVPWTNIGTVRDNIIFGHVVDEQFYRQVIHACALEPDLALMPDGDKTWIGERGGNLSGGQKQRIALARAAYSRAQMYVLDSPLSAVDMYTCQHIFKYCIEDIMIEGGGTVVLATHQTELFSKSDHLIVMQSSKMVYNDKYSFAGIKHLFPNFHGDGEAQGDHHHAPQQDKKKMKKTNHVLVETPKIIPEPLVPPTPSKEDRQGIYSWYFKQVGYFMVILATLVFIIGQIVRVYGDVWISVWSKRKFSDDIERTDNFYILIYFGLVMTFLSLAFFRAFFWYAICGFGSNTIHNRSFTAVLNAPMHFFHLTPVGKLLNYFSKDIDIIDDVLVDNMCMFQIFWWILILALGVVSYNLPFFLVIIAGLAVVFLFTVRNFILASVPCKKASSAAQANVVAHTAETLSGLAVVRAFRMQDRFVNDNLDFQARSTVTNFSVATLSLWLAFRVDIIGSLLVLMCCLLAILDDDLDAAVAGLIVSNSFQVLLFFSIMSRTLGEVHANMASVDQAKMMCRLEAEQQPTHEVKPPANWPSKGEIKFEGVVMPYLPGTPPVLKGINFEIREGEKIGVVGRTGAGKSSLIVALYRLAEISQGRIHVDNIDCSSVNLDALRRSMAIIPQEPVMFGGTLRSNLDPFGGHSDKELIDVLTKCLLSELLAPGTDGLETKVATMGSNFSLGTQQLICLARAMLNPSRILLLDEATAALDSDTNAAVQQVLVDHFSHRTIFTIAHRLDTIIDSDRILVMNAGLIAEFEPPEVLLDRPDSIFRELCMNTGSAQFEVLAARARSNAAKRA